MEEEKIPLAKEGVPFFLVPAFLALVFVLGGSNILAFLFSLASLFFMFFFRDPERSFTVEKGSVISPADGKVVFMSTVSESKYLGGECFKISIFMSPLDVHVNRAPLDCVINKIEYIPGRFLAADKGRASQENEQNALLLEAEGGRKLVMVQVAGFLARRIVCRARLGDRLYQGQRIGLIRMGSRVDLFLPSDFIPRVQLSDRVRAGQTTLGILP